MGTHLGAFPCLGGVEVLHGVGCWKGSWEAAGLPQPKNGRERNDFPYVLLNSIYTPFFGVAKKDVRFQGRVIFYNKSDLDLI